ncbi:MAG: DUF1772 domain-containing protein [Pseudomonadales bacterium]|nr:DUF1772 domain-containing protein [Pseudomonadales bacterium]
MEQLTLSIGILAALGSALAGGIFFAFSNFVMKALAQLPFSEGIAAMQSINIVAINPAFMGVFMGTVVLSLCMIGVALFRWNYPSAIFFLAGAVFYIAGSFFVTAFTNVPLNDQLAALSSKDPISEDVWNHYLDRWVMWNHVRGLAATAAALLYIIGIMRVGE